MSGQPDRRGGFTGPPFYMSTSKGLLSADGFLLEGANGSLWLIPRSNAPLGVSDSRTAGSDASRDSNIQALQNVVRSVVREELQSVSTRIDRLGAPSSEVTAARNKNPTAGWMSVQQAAGHAGVSAKTIRKWISKRGLSAELPGGGRQYRIRPRELEEFMRHQSELLVPDADEQVEKILSARGEKTKG